eukprot:jgi/Botrbrau1/11980/Bobra.0115s0016.1
MVPAASSQAGFLPFPHDYESRFRQICLETSQRWSFLPSLAFSPVMCRSSDVPPASSKYLPSASSEFSLHVESRYFSFFFLRISRCRRSGFTLLLLFYFCTYFAFAVVQNLNLNSTALIPPSRNPYVPRRPWVKYNTGPSSALVIRLGPRKLFAGLDQMQQRRPVGLKNAANEM